MAPLIFLVAWAAAWAVSRLLLGFALPVVAERAAPHVSIELEWWRATVRVHGSDGGLATGLSPPQRRALRRWFTAGAFVALPAAVCSVALLLSELRKLVGGLLPAAEGVAAAGLAAAASDAAPHLQLALPGITLPLSHAAPLWLALAASLAFHELGHALAAAAEGVQVNASGLSLVALLPAAFVELDSADLAGLGRAGMLRVATAGAWHNAVLGLACWVAAAGLARVWPASLLALLAPFHLLLGYAVSLSAALALLNLAPVHCLDGQQALEALLLRPRKPGDLPLQADSTKPADGGRARAVRWTLHAGTALYAAVVALHVLRMT